MNPAFLILCLFPFLLYYASLFSNEYLVVCMCTAPLSEIFYSMSTDRVLLEPGAVHRAGLWQLSSSSEYKCQWVSSPARYDGLFTSFLAWILLHTEGTIVSSSSGRWHPRASWSPCDLFLFFQNENGFIVFF